MKNEDCGSLVKDEKLEGKKNDGGVIFIMLMKIMHENLSTTKMIQYLMKLIMF